MAINNRKLLNKLKLGGFNWTGLICFLSFLNKREDSFMLLKYSEIEASCLFLLIKFTISLGVMLFQSSRLATKSMEMILQSLILMLL